MADTKLAKVGITVKESWKDDISYEVLDYTLWRVQDGGDGCGYIAKRANIGVVPNSDDSVWIKATQAGQSIYDLAVKYGHFVGTEEEFEAEYQADLQAARDAASETSATNTEIQEAEELRKTAENTRVEAETARQTAESGRQTAETARQTAETARNTAETQRGDNETTRQSQETARESAEQTRQSNEETRQSNETARESAEQERTADFEALKTDMQTAIGEADAATAAAVALNNQVAEDESARQQAESGRATAETQRQTAETQRGTNESTRQTQETSRQTAEQTRQTQEGTRQTQETARQTAEGNRASAESQRASNETARQTAETARETQATSDHERAEADHAIMAGYDNRLSDVEGDVTELEHKVIDLTSESYYEEQTPFINGKYITTNLAAGATVDVANPVSNGNYCYIIFPVNAGQKVQIKGGGASAPRLWAFTDGDYKLISSAAANATLSDYTEFIAPQNGYCIVNSTVGREHGAKLEERIYLKDKVEEQGQQIAGLGETVKTNYDDVRDQDQEIFLLDTEDELVFQSKDVEVYTGSATVILLPYLGKQNSVFVIKCSLASNYFRLYATNVATGAAIILYDASSTPASLPLTLSNPRTDLELSNIRIVGTANTTRAVFSINVTKANPIRPVIKAANAKKFLLDCPLPNYKTASKFSASDYSAMRTAEIYAAYDALVSAYPDYVTRTELGEVESRAIGDIPAETNTMYRYDFTPTYPIITSPQATVPKIKVMILSGTHPEWASIAALYRMMQSLCASWQNNDALEALRFNVHFIIIPAASPWALNHDSRGNANGVDMARNFPAGWQQGTYIQPPANTTYGGTEPLSETEAQLIWGVFNSEKNGMVAAIDYHSNVGTNYFFWCPNNPGDNFMAEVSMNFIKMIARQLYGKYPGLTPSTMIGYYDSTNPGGSFSYNATVNGVEGLSFECSHTVFDWMEDFGDVLTAAHDGIINFLIVLLRGLLGRQYSNLISPQD